MYIELDLFCAREKINFWARPIFDNLLGIGLITCKRAQLTNSASLVGYGFTVFKLNLAILSGSFFGIERTKFGPYAQLNEHKIYNV